MTINALRLAPVVACFSVMLSASTPATAQPVVPDADTVETTIEQRWEKDGQLKACKGCDIDVAFEGGVAVLTGEVPTESLRSRAARLARTKGVARVDNRITVEARQSVADKTRKGVDTAVSKTGQAVGATGEVVTDGWITSKVKAKLVGADELQGSSIDVSTKNHVVTLTGKVRSDEMRASAMRLAGGIDGVQDVVDKLVVSGQ